MRFFIAFCNHWNCTSLQPLHLRWFSHCFATIDDFCLVFLQWLIKTKIQKKTINQETKKQKNEKHTKWQDPTLCHYSPPLGCAILFFFFVFYFFGFLVFSFLFFWFVVGFLKGWQNNTKVKDLDLTLCQFAHFRGYKLAFGWFYWLLWACGSIRKSCKKTWQNAGITGGSFGGQITVGNFVCLYIFSKTVLNTCKKHRQPMNMSNLFWYWHCWLKPLS